MKKFWMIVISILGSLIFVISRISFSLGNEKKEQPNIEYPFTMGTVTAESLKIRSGLSTENSQIGLLSKGDIIHIYAKIDNWYLIKTENNLVGAVFADYVEGSSGVENQNENENQNETLLSQEEQIFFNLINNKRIENNLPEFELDEKLLNIARLKANDIVENKYFAHTSPSYGTIFEMLHSNEITYHKASENIARNLNAQSAIETLMNSEAHKGNILSQDFNYTGIAVTNSPEYGKIFVEIFIAK